MIVGNGIDIIETERIEKAITKNDRFLHKIFSEKERKYINKRNRNIQTIAGMFAAKEAISKSLGTGIREFKWSDIQIEHDDLGKPMVELREKAKEIAIQKNVENIHISISHIDKCAIAFAIAEN